MTTIGYGDITASSDLERFVMIFMTFISCGIFGYSINSFGNILFDFKKKRDVYLQELAKINQYFNQYNVDLVLQGRARKYIQYLYVDEKKNSACSIRSLSSLSEYMQNEIKRDVYVKRLQQVKVFNDILSEEVKQELVLKMKEHIYSPDQIIVDSRESREPQLYFVHSGQVQQFLQYDYNSHQKEIEVSYQNSFIYLIIFQNCKKTFRENQYFGLLNFVVGNGDSDFNYKSVGISYLLQISQSDFISVIKKDSTVFEKYSFLVDQIKFNKQYGIINKCCTSCFQRNHILKNCPFLFYEGKKEQITRNYFKQINEQIKHFKRKQQKNSINALVSQAYIRTQALLLVDQISNIQEEEYSLTFSLQDNDNEQYGQADQFFDTSYHKNDIEEEQLEEQELKHINTGKLSDQEACQNKEKENAETYKCSILDEELLMQEQKTFSDEQQQFSVLQHKKTKKTSFLENSEAHAKQVRRNTNERAIPSQFSQHNSSQCIKRQYSNFIKEIEQIMKFNFDHQPSQCTKMNCNFCLNIIYKAMKLKKSDKNLSSPQNETNKKGSYFQIKQDSRLMSLSCQPVSTSIQIASQHISTLDNNLNLQNIEMNTKQAHNIPDQTCFMHFDFDKIDTFQYYYPNNNYELVIRRLNNCSENKYFQLSRKFTSMIK
ncbi:hypothetical protein ABPG73_013237 [Tetrahymena malaccensis]